MWDRLDWWGSSWNRPGKCLECSCIPNPMFFLCLNPCSLPSPVPQNSTPSICPPSLAAQSPLSTPHLPAEIDPLPCTGVLSGNCRKHHLEPSLHLLTAVPALCHQRQLPFIIAADNGFKTRLLQDVRGYLAEGEKTLSNHMAVSALVWCQGWLLVKLGSHFACLRLLKEKKFELGPWND